MSFNVEEFFKTANHGDVIVAHKGSITSDLINDVLEGIENRLDALNEDSKVRKKIYNVLVEGLQNLYHHVDELPENIKENIEPKFGLIVVKKIDDHYQVITGNFINSNKIKLLKDKIDKINSLSKDELKDMYKFILNHQKLSAKGGGGLGLVDIARKSGGKMEYSFEHFQNDYYFFILNVLIYD